MSIGGGVFWVNVTDLYSKIKSTISIDLLEGLVANLLKMDHSRPIFLNFRLFNTVDSYQCSIKTLPMTGFEPWTSGFGRNHFAN